MLMAHISMHFVPVYYMHLREHASEPHYETQHFSVVFVSALPKLSTVILSDYAVFKAV